MNTKSIRNKIDTRNLLEHLVNVAQDDAMEVSVRSHGEEISPAMLLHLQDGVFDFHEFRANEAVVPGQISQS